MNITPEKLAESGTEHGHQAALFLWRAMNVHRLPQLKWMHAIPNGGGRSIATATALKAEGVRSGVSDIFLPAPVMCRPYISRGTVWTCKHGLYIEMKRPKKTGKAAGKLSEKQNEFRNDMLEAGYVCGICYTWLDAVACIEAYLRGEIT